jgi:hypothetical protein
MLKRLMAYKRLDRAGIGSVVRELVAASVAEQDQLEPINLL